MTSSINRAVVLSIMIISTSVSCTPHADKIPAAVTALTGMKLPRIITVVQEHDNDEYICEGVYETDLSELRKFSSDGSFSLFDSTLYNYGSLTSEAQKELLNSLEPRDLKAGYHLQTGIGLLRRELCTHKNRITFIADTTKGILWIRDEYPDASGDAPVCK